MKKTICMILALVLCIGLLAGCGGNKENAAPADEGETKNSEKEIGELNTSGSSTEGSEATPPPEEATYAETLTLLLDDKIAILDPFNAGSICSQMGNAYHMCYDTLVDYTLAGEYEPCLAESWDISEDYMTFTYHLRQDVVFHNGEPFTADDVVFTIENGKANPGCPLYDHVKKVDTVEAPDDYTVVMHLVDPGYDFLYETANIVGFVILNREAVEADPENGPHIGTGPFSVAEFVSSESITYERNDNYFGEKPYTKTFKFLYLAEDTARYIMFDNGEADFVVINSVYIPQYADDPKYTMASFVVNNCGYYSMNCTKAPFDDINFRLACAYATNDQEIVDLAFSGYAAAHDTGAMWGWTTAYKNTSIEKRAQDIDLAKDYLAKSTYDGRTISIAASMPHTKRVAAVVQSQLSAIGINCEVYECDGPTLTAQSMWGENDLDIICNSQVCSPLANSLKSGLTENNSNKASYINEEVVELMTKADVTPDGDERQAMYYRVQEIIAEEVPYVTTAHNALYTCMWAGCGGAKYFATAYNDYSMAYRIVEE